MNVRKFSLINSENATWRLTDPKFKVFASSPQGLGYSVSAQYLRLGDDAIETYSQYSLNNMTFTLLFYDTTLKDKYTKYQQFLTFLSKKGLYLLYETPASSKVYRRAVRVESLGKTEVNPDTSALECPLTIKPLGFWEDNVKNRIEVVQAVEDGKKYELERPYFYGQMSLSNVQITTNGLLSTPIEVTIIGTTTDPQFSVYDEDGNEYGVAKFVGDYDRVYINSDEANETIELDDGGVPVTNPYNYQDLSIGSPNETQVTFIKLKNGVSTFNFILGGSFSGSVIIEWRNRYVSI